jgi:hypothetical protein
LPEKADELNCNKVPTTIDPVLVTESDGFAKGIAWGGIWQWALRTKRRWGEKKKRTLDTEVTAVDEGAGDGQNLIGKEGDVERLWDGWHALEEVQNGLVTRFDGRDGRGGREDARVLHEVRSAEVRPDADVLDDLREIHHSRDIREHGRKVELALRRHLTERHDDFLRAKDVGQRRWARERKKIKGARE